MKFLKIVAVFIISAFVFAGCATSGASDVVITVDDEKITVGEIRFLMAQNVELLNKQFLNAEEDSGSSWDSEVDGKKQIEVIKENAVEHLVNYAVFSQMAKSEGITVSDSEVNSRMNAVYSLDKLINYRDVYGVPQGSVKSLIRKQVLYQKYISEIISFEDAYTPGDEELLKFFNDNYYKAQHILIRKNAEELASDTLSRVEEILDDLNDGEDFMEMMLDNSEDTDSFRSPDGYVFTNGEINDMFYNTVVNLSENQISEILETSYGFHIIKRVPVSEVDFAERETEVLNKYKNDYINSCVEQIKADCKVNVNEKMLDEITVSTGN